ncbi:hypothetical protein TorRG33x02_140440, partial [Trema orientale]
KGLALDGGVELITPSEAARLAGSAGDSSGDQAPIPRTELTHQSAQNGIFFWRPRPLHPVSPGFFSSSADAAVFPGRRGLIAAATECGQFIGVEFGSEGRSFVVVVVGFHLSPQYLPDLTARVECSMERQDFIGHFFPDFFSLLLPFFIIFSFFFQAITNVSSISLHIHQSPSLIQYFFSP